MVAALALPYASPSLRSLRVVHVPWPRQTAPDDANEALAATIAPPPQLGEQALPASENTATVNNALPDDAKASAPMLASDVRSKLRNVPIEDASGHALDAFFTRLARTQRGDEGAITRILHYGDSTIASDYISGTVRRRLQARFGDSGHGFILTANPWEWYFHNDVTHGSAGEWKASRLAGPITPDGLYGLGGVSFASYGGGVAWFGTASRGDYGRRVSRFDVYYLEQPGGGDVELSVRGGPQVRFSTRGSAKVSRVHTLQIEDGEARVALRAMGGGQVRLFGVALERDRPGVVYDALGAHAAMAAYWRRQKPEHWKEQLALRDPSLIILQYGTNESDLWKLDRDDYEAGLAKLVDEMHEIAGNASLLLVAPLDRAEVRNGRLATRRVILDLVALQRRVALAHGAGFWDTFAAMGGEGAIARWVKARPQLAGEDLTHPTPLGAEVIGDMLSASLVEAFERWHPSPSE